MIGSTCPLGSSSLRLRGSSRSGRGTIGLVGVIREPTGKAVEYGEKGVKGRGDGG